MDSWAHLNWAKSIGPSASQVVEKMMAEKQHPEQAYQAALGIISLSKRYVGSTIITSQLPVSGWHEYLGAGLSADAIIDRLIHGAHRFELRAVDSLRRELLLEKEKLTQSDQSDQSEKQSKPSRRYATTRCPQCSDWSVRND